MIESIKKRIKDVLSEKRYAHTLKVAQIASELAKNYGIDPEKAEIAGLLHDCAKEIPLPLLLSKAEQYGVELDEIERQNPALLHAIVGAQVAYNEFGIKDEDILSAIAKHTTGSKEMSALDQIIYVADYLDPLRNYQNVELIKELAMTDLDLAVGKTAGEILKYLKIRDALIHPNTLECENNYAKKI
ncbi:MAG: bis(5'-nucleosyl)-tetraphosphatase (symmetrical) YqeK [Candidatus Margulisiibacteriota bacterium]